MLPKQPATLLSPRANESPLQKMPKIERKSKEKEKEQKKEEEHSNIEGEIMPLNPNPAL